MNDLDLSKLYSLSFEDAATFQNHFYSHFSHELIVKRINELLSIQLPDLDTYFGRQKVATCKVLLPFIKKIYNLAPKSINNPFWISQNHYASVFNVSQKTISNWIQRMCDLGILICLEKQNTFETEATQSKYVGCYDFIGYCLYYVINKDRCRYVIDYMNDICNNSNTDISLVEKVVSDKKSSKKETKSKKIDFAKKYFNYSRDMLHSLCYDINNMKYNNECNDNYNTLDISLVEKVVLPEIEQIAFEDLKQGTRIASAFCSLPTKKHFGANRLALENINHDTYTREDYLDNIFGEGNWIEWDRKASVPFITRLVNKGIITPNDYDLYIDLNGTAFKSEEERDAFKLFFMRLYFAKSIEDCKRCAKRAWDEWFYGVPTDKGFKPATLYNWMNLKETNNTSSAEGIKIDDRLKNKISKARSMFMLCMKDAYEQKGNLTREEQYQCIDKYIDSKWNNIEKVLGPRIEDVFMYESSLYLQVRQILNKERILQCYDGFYFKKDLKIDIMNIIKNIIEEK